MSDLKCTNYTELAGIEEYWKRPCQCPVCGGFLKWLDSNTVVCNKCKSDLLIIPDKDETTGEELEWGKICPISQPKKIA